MKIKGLLVGCDDMPIINYTYFVLYFQLFRQTDLFLRGDLNVIGNEIMAIAAKKDDEMIQNLGNYLSNLNEGYERMIEGVPFVYKCFDCMIKSNDVTKITDSETFYGREFGLGYPHIIGFVNDFYDKIQDELLRLFGNTPIFFETIQEMKKDFVELSHKLQLVDVNSIDDIERFLKEISEEKDNNKKHTFFKDAEITYRQAYLSMFAKLGIDDLEKQTKTSVSSYYAKIVEIQRENTAKQSANNHNQ